MQKLDTIGWLWVALSAFFIIFGYYTAVLVMRSGEISFISPFRYSAILFALIFGMWFLGNSKFVGNNRHCCCAFAGIFLLYRANSSKIKSLTKFFYKIYLIYLSLFKNREDLWRSATISSIGFLRLIIADILFDKTYNQIRTN